MSASRHPYKDGGPELRRKRCKLNFGFKRVSHENIVYVLFIVVDVLSAAAIDDQMYTMFIASYRLCKCQMSVELIYNVTGNSPMGFSC